MMTCICFPPSLRLTVTLFTSKTKVTMSSQLNNDVPVEAHQHVMETNCIGVGSAPVVAGGIGDDVRLPDELGATGASDCAITDADGVCRLQPRTQLLQLIMDDPVRLQEHAVAIMNSLSVLVDCTFGDVLSMPTPIFVAATIERIRHATAPLVISLASMAMNRVTLDTEAAIMSSLATIAVADALARMPILPTTPGAVEWFLEAMSKIIFGQEESVNAAFATTAVVDALARISTHATTPRAVENFSSAICNITDTSDASVRAAFATTAFVNALAAMLIHATNPKAIEWFSRAICNITSVSHGSVKAAFATAPFVDALATMSIHATTPDAVEWFSRALSSITSGTEESVKAAFATAALADALETMSAHATTAEAAWWLSTATNGIMTTPEASSSWSSFSCASVEE